MRWPQTTDHSHSLLCSAKSLRKRLIRSLTENNRLSSHQSKNRSFHSTETLNILVSDSMLDAIDKKMITALILDLVYLSKAFDVGASSEVVKWFKSYLSDRSHYVRIGSTVSSILLIAHDVPQGSRPMLHNLYPQKLS